MNSLLFIRKMLIALLCVALSVVCVPAVLAYSLENDEVSTVSSSSQEAVYEKSEVVYVNLSAQGEPESVYVVNYFDVSEAGLISDYGNYSDVKLLAKSAELTLDDDEVSFEVEEGDFYYQGYAQSTALPWNVNVTYELDGIEISAEELAGASGDLVIQIDLTQNDEVDSIFYESFMVQVSVTLDDQVASGIQADDATAAKSADTTVLSFVSLPGSDGSFTVEAQVQDFSMDSISFTALPYSLGIEIPDTDSMIDDMTELSDAITELSEGVSELASGADDLADGTSDLSSGSQEFSEGLSQLSSSSSSLVDASEQINSALIQISEGFSSLDMSSLEQLEALPDALNQLADSLESLSEASNSTQQACAAVLDSMPEISLTDEEISALMIQVSGTESENTVSSLVASYQSLQVAQAALEGANTMLSTSVGALDVQAQALRSLAAQLEDALGSGQIEQLSALADALSTLSGQYTLMHSGLAQYTEGLDALAEGYDDLESGTESVAEGMAEFDDGVTSLDDAVIELNDATVTLPESVQEQIDAMTEEFEFTEFDSSSYMSDKNETIETVQFVLATAAIEQPEEEQVEEPEEELSIWDRFLALFS